MPDQTDLRERLADIVTPFLMNFSDEEAAKVNAEEVATALLAVFPPPADRAALERIRAIHQPVAGEGDTKWCQVCSQEERQPQPVGWWVPWPCPTLQAVNEAPSAAPPSADRATVLREAADGFDRHSEQLLNDVGDKAVFVAKALRDQAAVWSEAAETLRRMAAEAQQQESGSGCAHCVCCHAWGDREAHAALVRDDGVEAQQQPDTETWDMPDARPGTTDHTLTKPVQHAPGRAVCCPNCRTKGNSVCTDGEGECCGVEPPSRADDPNSQWGDCWCTRPPGHDGEHRCEPCTERHGAPDWNDASAVPGRSAAADTSEETDIIAPYCGGFPDTCPNRITVPPAPPHHGGGIRCGCYDGEEAHRG